MPNWDDGEGGCHYGGYHQYGTIPGCICMPCPDPLQVVADAALRVYRAWDRELHYTNKMFALGRALRDAGFDLRGPDSNG